MLFGDGRFTLHHQRAAVLEDEVVVLLQQILIDRDAGFGVAFVVDGGEFDRAADEAAAPIDCFSQN